MKMNLLEKTELWIEPLHLSGVNLNQLAATVAAVLQLPLEKVLVVDVRENHITLDIMQKCLKAEQFFGKGTQLLSCLKQIPGVEIFPNTEIHSEGVLGLIALDEKQAREVLNASKQMGADIRQQICRRVLIFPTGFEVKKGMIEDTNTPFLVDAFKNAGYKAVPGPVLDDDMDLIAGRLRRAVDEGYGVVITTGGIGAEEKDKSVEAMEKIAEEAATPYIIRFNRGTGRHYKDGVRLGVGRCGLTLIINLPGPNDEVQAVLPVLLNGIEAGLSPTLLAENLAEILRWRWRENNTGLNFNHHPGIKIVK